MKFLILLLSCSTCLAQFPYSGTDWYFSRITTPDSVLPPGIAFRWSTNNLTVSPVPLWTDRIQGYTWAQSTVNNQPLWDADGVQFWSTNNFVATNLTEASWSVLLIMKMRDVGGNHMILGDSTAGGHVYVGQSTASALYNTTLGGNGVNPITTIVYDLIGAQTAVTPTWNLYTNGISAWTGGASWNSTTIISKVGNAAASTWQFNGYIHEFIVWTNQGVWSSTTISNVHWYATNTFPHTP